MGANFKNDAEFHEKLAEAVKQDVLKVMNVTLAIPGGTWQEALRKLQPVLAALLDAVNKASSGQALSVGACMYTVDGQPRCASLSRAQCDAIGGSFSPGPCP